MTAKAAFEPDEWKLVEEGPTSAAMLVITSQRGGTFRETLAMGKEYSEARRQHGQSELLDELVGARPHVDHTRFHSPEELTAHVVARLQEAVAVLQKKAEAQEVEDYRTFVVNLSERVAGAHSEGAQPVSEHERAAIEAIKGALG
ncbi:MAG TPA: hypothetical protein VK721_16000 [Solirubrobacteraceae bacterium]|jgi:hypothetical protein|nr:hypothetical protein [Solirubrobacteraceae bacterium]